MELSDFFNRETKAAIAFSGGVDSAYLLYAAKKYGAEVCAYYVKTQFQPEFEYIDAVKLAETVGADMKTIRPDILKNRIIAQNPENRCYLCKKTILSTIAEQAAADGFKLIAEGTNASDDAGDRPGMAAVKELSVVSPLRECGLTKADVRRLSKEAGLFTWNKPSYSCLATRIMNGEQITGDKLRRIEAAECVLSEMGFSDLRVRLHGENAVLQFTDGDIEKAFSKRRDIFALLSEYFGSVAIDLKERERSE